MSALPTPDAHAQLTSQRLLEHLQQDIAQVGGWIPFSRYMEQVLYAPGLGYYAAGSHKLGQGGDFMTAPERSFLFGHTLARQLAELLPQTSGTLYEFGAGTGTLAVDLLTALKAQGRCPERYIIIEIAPDLIERQQQTLNQACLADWVEWHNRLPDTLDGVVIANELLDAMPCELIHWKPAVSLQRGVVWSQAQLAWQDRPIEDNTLKVLAQMLKPCYTPYLSEINLNNRAFIRSLAHRLVRGGIILIDYGFSAAEYYHPQRYMGTLMGHYRHHMVDNPFFLPGLVDLTCHVDFTAIAETGLEAGLDLIGYTTQAQFLINLGMTDLLAKYNPEQPKHYLPRAAEVQTLLSPAEMGELFKVIGFGKKMRIDWQGFSQGDRCHTL